MYLTLTIPMFGVTSAILLPVHNKRVHSLSLLITFSLLDCIVTALLRFSKFLYLSVRTEVLLWLWSQKFFWLFECRLVFLCRNDCESFSLSKILCWLIQTEVLYLLSCYSMHSHMSGFHKRKLVIWLWAYYVGHYICFWHMGLNINIL